MAIFGLHTLVDFFDRFRRGRKIPPDTMKRVTMLVHNTARRYAPISPTQAQKNRNRKTKRKVKRKATATTRAKPGGLVRSIEFDVSELGGVSQGTIYIASNSEAGKYAKRIHDEKYKSWTRRGIGTIAKGT